MEELTLRPLPPFVQDLEMFTHWNLLLHDHDSCILSSNSDGSDSRSGDGLESVLCEREKKGEMVSSEEEE